MFLYSIKLFHVLQNIYVYVKCVRLNIPIIYLQLSHCEIKFQTSKTEKNRRYTASQHIFLEITF